MGRDTSSKNKKRLDSIINHPNFQMIYCDFAKDNLTEYLSDITHVYHLGAKTFVDHSIRDPGPFIESNIVGTYNLLEAVRKSKTVISYVQISTDEVYGPCEDKPHTEESPLNPKNPYSATKASADLVAMSYYNTYGLPIVLTRTENIYGPYQGKEKVIPYFTKLCLEGKPMTLYGDGEQTRRWLHVDDQCSALDKVSIFGKNGEVYNIAGAEEISNINLAKKIAKVLEVPENIEFITDRPGHDKRYAIDSTKIRKLGWEPKLTLDTGFEQTVNWFKDNKWWLK